MMSKKHYVAIAARIANNAGRLSVRQQGHIIDAGYRQAIEDVSEDLADYFASENPKFDRARFLEACGVSTNLDTVERAVDQLYGPGVRP